MRRILWVGIVFGCISLAPCVLSAGGPAETTTASLSAGTSATSETIPDSISAAPEPGKWQQFWINRVREFIAENATLDPGTRNVVFVGDSLTQHFKLSDYFPGLPVLNRGIGSDGICDFPGGRNIWRGVTRRMKESIFDCRPSHLFLMTGTNDVGVQDVPLEYWFGAYKYVVSQARQRYPDMKVIVMTCPPCGEPDARQKTLNARIQEWNRLIREYAKAEGFRLIDLHALLAGTDGRLPPDLTRDGLHFNKAGYDRWAKAAGVILREDGAIPVAPGVKQPAEAPRPSPGH